MGLGGAGKLGRVILVAINIIFLIIGLVFLALGIVMRVDNDTLYTDEVKTTLDQVDLGANLSLGSLANALNIIFIVLGVCIIVIAGLGFCGACCKLRPLLVVYAIVIILILITQLVGVILWFVMRDEIKAKLETELYATLAEYDDVDSTSETSQGWDKIFIDYKCCGTTEITASKNPNHFQNSKYWNKKSANDKVPKSCCKGATRANYKTYSKKECTEDLLDNNQEGCTEKIEEEMVAKYQTGLIVTGIILLVIEIIAVIFAFVVCVAIGKEDEMVV